MNRIQFLKSIALIPLAKTAMNLNEFHQMTDYFKKTEKMPVLFLGHGSPMNAIEENQFVAGFRNISKGIPKPNAILCISAHWETRGTQVTAMKVPPTIHDFGGFPKELFDVQYPAPGSPELATEVKGLIQKTPVVLDEKWGLDHGCWSVVKHLYPKADIPIIQMSLDYYQSAQFHYDLAKELAPLRHRGILILGSGNIVHNLGKVAWDKLEAPEYGYDWALEADATMKKYILSGNHAPLINYKDQGSAFNLAIPTPDHFLPLLYALGLKENAEKITIFNDKLVGGSLSMTSVKID
jgi:4,5-DOPA dioxygenase extradiol